MNSERSGEPSAKRLADTDEYLTFPTIADTLLPLEVSAGTQVNIAGMSHQGKVRANNEDVFLVVRHERAMQALWTNLMPGQIPARYGEVGYGMVVADGMGGAAAGEVASRLAVTTLIHHVLQTPDWIMRIGADEVKRIMERMEERFRQVDEVLTEEAALHPKLAGMGTTMTLAHSLGPDLFLGHIGDSRVYYCRGDTIHQLTRDHTSAQRLANEGLISQEDVATHHLRHVLTRSLGGHGGHVATDVRRVHLSDGDQILLCTDGLTNMVDDVGIAAILRDAKSAHEACQRLVDAALANGGRDNVTVVVARYRFNS